MKTTLRVVLGTLLGAVIGGGAVAAHFTGHLTAVYHKLGWHTLASNATQAPEKHSGHDMDEHAGHTMDEHASMPGMEMASGETAGGEMSGMNMPGMAMGPQAGSAAGVAPSTVPGHAVITMSPLRQQTIGVRIGAVERDQLVMSIRAVGVIEPDQTRLVRVQTRINGWVTKVFVNYVGQDVKPGDPLLEIYSPELLSTQEEFLVALGQEPRGRKEGEPKLAHTARRRLKLAGVPDDEIDELAKTKKARDTLVLKSPIAGRVLERNLLEGSYIEPATVLYRIADLSVVWLQARIYEYELPHVEVGQKVAASLLSAADAEFEGRIAFIEPIVEEMTRTVKVRVEIPNTDDALKPGMYANLMMSHEMGQGLLVPDTAVLRTGERDIAFRALPGDRFEPVAVKLGGRFGERLEVLSGLAEGDKILTSATFLVDSESRLRATSAGAGHHHH